jgi:5'-nucleotidase
MDAETNKLVIAISSRALFDLEESHRVFTEQGVEAYYRYQIEHENDPLAPGVAFPLVKKLLALNVGQPNHTGHARSASGADNTNSPLPHSGRGVGEREPSPAGRGNEGEGRGRGNTSPSVEVILLSRNDANTGLRIFNSIRHHGLAIERAAFAGGSSPYPYIVPFRAHLFLSADPEDVRKALEAGVAAATLLPRRVEEGANGPSMARAPRLDPIGESGEELLRIAFDGDAVLFADVAERVYKQHGLETFNRAEAEAAHEPLPGGPFKGFLAALHRIQSHYPAEGSPIRTALFTARGAPAHERVIRTLRAWNIRIDEAAFLGGLDKGEFLRAFRADIFFDDQRRHCESAHRHVPTGHVPHGVANEG